MGKESREKEAREKEAREKEASEKEVPANANLPLSVPPAASAVPEHVPSPIAPGAVQRWKEAVKQCDSPLKKELFAEPSEDTVAKAGAATDASLVHAADNKADPNAYYAGEWGYGVPNHYENNNSYTQEQVQHNGGDGNGADYGEAQNWVGYQCTWEHQQSHEHYQQQEHAHWDWHSGQSVAASSHEVQGHTEWYVSDYTAHGTTTEEDAEVTDA